MEKPIRPPLVFESRFAVCLIVWSQATAEKPWLFCRCTAKFDEISGRAPIRHNGEAKCYVVTNKGSVYIVRQLNYEQLKATSI